ncbi:protein SMG7-like isoform X2 [Juglans regia]|uniref:Protein SMG7-like isoform X2 n=1 Tax=Juglans regia TaxID=51240 RepID=A0A6P9EPP8_JUGRE|nr:protein SMG7-like isoform X2 [Juglans regia]
MMAVLMDNSLDLSSRERAQRLYKLNVDLENKRRRLARASIPSDPTAWQRMRDNFEGIILEDHTFSEQHDVEFGLWQLHYRRIEELRSHLNDSLDSNGSAMIQDGKSSSRPDRISKIRSQFKTFLSEATGFYHDLMLKIRAKYGLPLNCFPGDPENQFVVSKDGNKSAEMKKCWISCHRCLIYLGDLSRYKGLYGDADSKSRDYAAASSYYMQASSIWPSSGNPHHQLALLASYSGDELVTIFRYFRSLAVDNPFSTARDNLIIAFEKNRQNFSQLLGDGKASSIRTARVRMHGKRRGRGGAMPLLKHENTDVSSVKETASSISDISKAFSIKFVRLNGILFTRTSLETFGDVFSMVRVDLLELLSSGPEDAYNFGSNAADSGMTILRLITILIATAHIVSRENENQSCAKMLQRSVLLQNAYTAIFEFMGLILERCMQLFDPSKSYLLPGVLIFMEWLACHPEIAAGSEVEEKEAAARYDEGETANRLALWEDYELRGFLPLVPAHMILDFSRKQSLGSDNSDKERQARFQRIIAAGKSLVSIVWVGQEYVSFDPMLKKFAIGIESHICDDFVLTSSWEMPVSNGMGHPPGKKMNVGNLQPEAQPYLEGEEEDEIIVFQPSVTDNHADAIDPKFSYNFHAPLGNAPLGDKGCCIESVSAPLDGKISESTLDTDSINPNAPISLTTILPQHLQSIQPCNSKWLLEQQVCLANGLNSLNLTENRLVGKPSLQEHFEVLEPAALSDALPQTLDISAGNELFAQVSDSRIPSKFDSTMSTGARFDSLSLNSSMTLPASLRKNRMSRPLRHFGPPPGFGPVPPKPVGESLSMTTLEKETLKLDDYSWLDGYQLPLPTKDTVFDKPVTHTAQSYHQASKGNMGMICFPFPGKQVPTLQVQMENQKNWQGYQAPDYLKVYQRWQQQQQLCKINQDSIPMPKQYEGQTLWDGHFFV